LSPTHGRDLEIARIAKLKPITEIARDLGLEDYEVWVPWDSNPQPTG